MLYFRLFCQKISKPCVKFSRVWTKNTIVWEYFEKILKFFDENSMEKLNFYLFFGKFVAKNRNFGINIIFLQQFSPVRGGLNPPNPPAYATAPCNITSDVLKKYARSDAERTSPGQPER